ncbi:AAA family ATPase [Vibrio jasicida]|uniref:AAA family ATPase n=1 Tax=Vibrio jasicida TaxID=766224 RepID=UPI00039DE4AD|nr:AAA family ATPase [Vibrio jasicida]
MSLALDKSALQFRGFTFTRGSDGYQKPTPWLVKDYLPSDSFGVIYGQSGSLKTFIALEIACAVATGSTWNNKSVDAGAVLYIAAEGGNGVSSRLKAWETINSLEATDVFKHVGSVFVARKDVRDEFTKAMKELESSLNVKFKLVIFDTLAQNFEGDENSSQAMSEFVRGCNKLRNDADVSVMCIHHTGKDEAKGSRGSNALVGACDYEYHVKRRNNSLIATLINTKQKDAEPSETVELEFESVPLDIRDGDQKPITSLARVKPISVKTKQTLLEQEPIVQCLKQQLNGSATREAIKQRIYSKETIGNWGNSETKDFYRKFNKLEEAGLVKVTQISSNRRSMQDIACLAA